MKAKEFLPEIVLRYDREKPWQEWLSGTVLFADVSGFTPMAEALSVLGAEGAEILTDILNRYFASMISIIHAHGGQVMKFGGDALQCFFPENELSGTGLQAAGGRRQAGNVVARCMGSQVPEKARGSAAAGGPPALDSGSSIIFALRAARLMQEAMPRFQNIKTPIRKFALKMKIGLAHGECLLAGVGDPAVRCDYLFAGAPVDAASEAEHHAVAGEIILSCSRRLKPARDLKMQIADCKVKEIAAGFWRILESQEELEAQSLELAVTSSSRPSRAVGYRLSATASAYLIAEIHEMVAAGYARHVGALLDVAPAFLRFEGFSYTREAFDLEFFHQFFTSLMEVTQGYGGRLNRISTGDKGSTCFILFGAPNPIEKKEELAAQWALDVQELIPARFPGLSISMGMHAGRIFSGIVGGAGRSEYTVMGDAVNTSARLMQETQSGQVVLSGAMVEKIGTSFKCVEIGKRQIKGKSEPLSVYELLRTRRTTRVSRAKGALAGRSHELRVVLDRLELARKGQPGMLVIEGEPGVGKSCLAEHILASLERDQWELWPTKGEISRQSHPYAPWLDLLSAQAFGDKKPSWHALKAACGVRGTTFLVQSAELLGLPVPKNIRRAKYDQETLKRLFHREFVEWLLGNAAGKPLLLFMDDLHWFDTLSLELLAGLMNRLKGQTLFILAASRPGWNKKEFESRPAFLCLSLSALDLEGIGQLAQTMLQGKVHESLVRHFHTSSRGNPFFVEQHVNYMKAQGALEQRLGEWRMRRGAEAGAAAGGDIVMARVGALPASQRIHLQTAACVGPVFSKAVLEKVLDFDYNSSDFESLVRQGLLAAFPKADPQHNTHSFSHALIQETAYRSLPHALRKRNHKRIGLAMESLFSKRIVSLHPNLSDHFALAGDRPRVAAHAWAAGKALYDGLSFPESVIHLERAYSALKRSQKDKRSFPVGLTLADAYIRVGRYSDCIALTKRIQRSAARLRQWDPYFQAILSDFDAKARMGDHSYYKRGYTILNGNRNMRSLHKTKLHYYLGIADYRRGFFSRAEEHFHCIVSGKQGSLAHPSAILSLMWLSSIERKRGKFEEATEHIHRGIALARRRSKGYLELRLEIESSNILMDSHKYPEAKARYYGLIPRTEEYGDHYLLAGILLNLGDIDQRLCNWQSAMNHLTEAARLFKSVNATGGQAAAYSWMGVVMFHQALFEEAYKSYLQAIRLFEETNEMTEACYGYYNLAEVCLKLDRTAEARSWYQKGIRSFKPEDNPRLHAMFKQLKDEMDTKSSNSNTRLQ